MTAINWPLLASSSHDDPIIDIINVILTKNSSSACVLASQLVSGDFRSILEDRQGMLNTIGEQNPKTAEDLITLIRECRPVEKDSRSELAYLFSAIACLNTFIQVNFTGPFFDLAISEDLNKACLLHLASDGESAFSLVYYPSLLVASLAALEDLIRSVTTDSCIKYFTKWWYSRAIVIHQSLLTGISNTLYTNLVDNLPNITELDSLASEHNWPAEDVHDLKVRILAEIARADLVFDQESRAKTAINKAKSESHLKTLLTGFKGKKTKFQSKAVSQLVYIAKSHNNQTRDLEKEGSEVPLPTNLELKSDLLLEKPEFNQPTIAEEDGEQNQEASEIDDDLKDIDPNHQPELKDIDSALILLEAQYIKNSAPHKHALIQEELMAMINRILDSPSSSVNWTLFSRALWERSLLEADSSQTVERGVLQIQSLVEESGQGKITSYITQEGAQGGSVEDRLKYIHQVVPLPRWALDIALAQKFMSIGMVKSATEVYERLELWADVALCYAVIGQETTAEEVMKKHLEKNPDDARAWCIYGDMTNNLEYWEKSWEVGKYAAAKRAIGNYYHFPPKESGVSRDLTLAAQNFRESLSVNPLHFNGWFIYGCIGLESESWETAAEAFTRCVSLDENDSKSWSNLASALLQMHKPQQAFNALQRAIRTDAELKNWRIWDNFVRVAIDLKEWQQAVYGTNRLVDIRGKKDGEACLDISTLEAIAQELVETDVKEASDPHKVFPNEAIKLLIHKVPPLITSNPRLWKMVARVHIWLKQPWNALDDYEKAFRILTNNPQLDESEAIWNDAVNACEDLVDAYTNFGEREGRMGEGSLVCKDWKFKARSAIRSLIGKGKLYWEDSEGWERLAGLKENL